MWFIAMGRKRNKKKKSSNSTAGAKKKVEADNAPVEDVSAKQPEVVASVAPDVPENVKVEPAPITTDPRLGQVAPPDTETPTSEQPIKQESTEDKKHHNAVATSDALNANGVDSTAASDLWQQAEAELEERAERRLSGAHVPDDLISEVIRGSEFEDLLLSAEQEALSKVQRRLSGHGVQDTATEKNTAAVEEETSESAAVAEDVNINATEEDNFVDGALWDAAQVELDERAERRLSNVEVDKLVPESIRGTEFDVLLQQAEKEALERVSSRLSLGGADIPDSVTETPEADPVATSPAAETEDSTAAPSIDAQQDVAEARETDTPKSDPAAGKDQSTDLAEVSGFVSSSKQELGELKTMVKEQTTAAKLVIGDAMKMFSAQLERLGQQASTAVTLQQQLTESNERVADLTERLGQYEKVVDIR